MATRKYPGGEFNLCAEDEFNTSGGKTRYKQRAKSLIATRAGVIEHENKIASHEDRIDELERLVEELKNRPSLALAP